MADVAIIGGGIIGVSTALYIKQTAPHLSVKLFGENLTPFTTGDGAAGLWDPHDLSQTPSNKIVIWSKETFNFILKLRKEYGAEKSGCFTMDCYQLYEEDNFKAPEYKEIFPNYRILDAAEVNLISPHYKSGYACTVLISEGVKLIPLLMNQFVMAGGVIVQRKIENFDELHNEGHKVIVNCAGLFGGHLADDPQVFPIRGQILRVRAPWINKVYMLGDCHYIIPRSDFVVLGGTSQVGNWNTNVDPNDRKNILNEVSRVFPDLKTPTVLGEWVGLRPGRTQVRIEVERRQLNKDNFVVVHNYGHGGSGLTMFWGCAIEAGNLVINHLKNEKKNKKRSHAAKL